MTLSKEKISFYQKLSKIWFALFFLNIALNIYPLIQKSDATPVVKAAQSWSTVCASHEFRSEQGSHKMPGILQVSAGVAAGTLSFAKKAFSFLSLPRVFSVACEQKRACSFVATAFLTQTFIFSKNDRGPPLNA